MVAIHYLKLWALKWKIYNGPCLNQDCRACLLRARFGGVDAEVSPPAPGPSSAGTRSYPRLRGDHFFFIGRHHLGKGSPPLTRGPHAFGLGAVPQRGITPAYAGTTWMPSSYTRTPTDHPRLRGDHRSQAQARPSRKGSPPLTRGPHLVLSNLEGYRGITPAYAGTTYINSRRCCYS